MFQGIQRLKGAIDSRIAEEQARQRNAQQSPSRSASGTKRTTSRSRAASPAVRATRSKPAESKTDGVIQKGPDPKDFEPEFLIEDEDIVNGTEAPKPVELRDDGTPATEATTFSVLQNGEHRSDKEKSLEQTGIDASQELPTDVQVRLRKLERLESRYQDLLRSYRIAHARVSAIEPFENTLREHTPLTSINDPGALVEYLNQLNLKGDMVLDELKRVTTDRAMIKQRLDEAEKNTRKAWDEVAKLRDEKAPADDAAHDQSLTENQPTVVPKEQAQAEAKVPHEEDQSQSATKSPPFPSAKPRTPLLPGMSLFSPRAKVVETPNPTVKTDEFFSYDSEVPRLESELTERQNDISRLETEIAGLKGDLAVARESTQSMLQTLEESTRELNILREGKDQYNNEIIDQRSTSENTINRLQADLESANGKLGQLEQQNLEAREQLAEREAVLTEARAEVGKIQNLAAEQAHGVASAAQLLTELNGSKAEVSSIRSEKEQGVEGLAALNDLTNTLREELTKTEQNNQGLKAQVANSVQVIKDLQKRLADLDNPENTVITQDTPSGEVTTNKKKNKRKKRSNKATLESSLDPPSDIAQYIEQQSIQNGNGTDAVLGEAKEAKIQETLSELRTLLTEKDAAIQRLHAKLKDQEGMLEEIDSLRDGLVNIGQDHVTDKDKIKDLVAEKTKLGERASVYEAELSRTRESYESSAASSEEARRILAAQFDDLKVKAAILQTELFAAQELASSRFKDLSDLRTVLQKAQPELTALRNENGELKTIKEELTLKITELQKIEGRHDIFRAQVTDLKTAVRDKDLELQNLGQKLNEETSGRAKAEETSGRIGQELQSSEKERKSAIQSLEKASKDLLKSQEDVNRLKAQLRDLEDSLRSMEREGAGLKEDIELKTAQHASAESLMSSMRDQTTEMAIQTKEARERCESLDEELADAHRLLSERSREGETMRRLLAEVEGRADSRIREMKERMDTVIEERDRAEDDASTSGRRRVRELEEVRNKLREAERSLHRVEEDKEALDMAQRDWKRRCEELEQQSKQSMKEAEDVKKAMAELGDALDESERQARDMEKQKAELRHSLEDTQFRLDKLQKSNKIISEELRSFQAAKARTNDSRTQSPRSSIDTTQSRARIGSPAAKAQTSSAAFSEGVNGQPAMPIDYVYLKNVLLQFLEQKDKKHQMQLIPVLGMLLHFDRKDEQKWMAAVTTK
ncbi:hypothetical protein MMC13_005666 [Lambiella insularis]|nr:hypothetical protein [Lambiella insularis]